MNFLSTKIRGELHENHPLASYTSWKIGGPAAYFYEPSDLEDLAAFLKYWKKDPIIFLGAATNVLISDAGIKGTVIHLRGCLNKLQQLDAGVLRAEAGVSCSRLVQQCVHLDLGSAAFLAGIPGTVGGALAMNAGAYGDNIWHHVSQIETINREGIIRIRRPDEFQFGYRNISGLAPNEWFAVGNFKFMHDQECDADSKVRTILQRRQASQPLDLPSCGSVFRNPQGDYAARLIESCGLKGMQIGGAKISEKHANFIVNEGDALANDVKKLIKKIIETVEQQHGIILTPEVHFF